MNKFSKFALSFYIISIVLTLILIFTNGIPIALEPSLDEQYRPPFYTGGTVRISGIICKLIFNMILNFIIFFSNLIFTFNINNTLKYKKLFLTIIFILVLFVPIYKYVDFDLQKTSYINTIEHIYQTIRPYVFKF